MARTPHIDKDLVARLRASGLRKKVAQRAAPEDQVHPQRVGQAAGESEKGSSKKVERATSTRYTTPLRIGNGSPV